MREKDEFIEFLEKIQKDAPQVAARWGISREDAKDASSELVASYFERYKNGKLKGPLPKSCWIPEFHRKCESLRSKRFAPLHEKDELISTDLLDHMSDLELILPEEKQLKEDLEKDRKETTDLLDEAVKRFATQKQVRRFLLSKEVGPASHELAKHEGVSRTSVYEGVKKKAKHKGLAGSILIVCEEKSDDLAKVLFGPNFSNAGLLSSEVIRTFDYLVSNPEEYKLNLGKLKEGFSWLWEIANKKLLNVLSKPSKCAQYELDELACIPTCFFVMLCAARLPKSGSDFQYLWKSSWKACKRAGLLKNPHTRRQLVTVGSYADEPGFQVDFLREEESQDHELAQILLYVCGGTRSRLPFQDVVMGEAESFLKYIRGDPKHLIKSLEGILNYDLYCLRNKRYDNEGLHLMILSWPLEVFREAKTAGITVSEELLRKLLNVLEMEKSRLNYGKLVGPVYKQVLDSISSALKAS